MKRQFREWFKEWADYFPLPAIAVDYDLRILLANKKAINTCNLNFTTPQYLETHFQKELLPVFLDFKTHLKGKFYVEQEIKLDQLGYVNMIGHRFDDEDTVYYLILLLPLVYKEEYLEIKNQYEMLVHYSNDSIIVTDTQQKILDVNPAFSKLTGYTFREVKGHFPTILSSGRQDKKFYKEMFHDMERKGYFKGELVDRKKNGEMIYTSSVIVPLKNEKGDVSKYLGILQDITQVKLLRTKLNSKVHKDPLTGVQNRESFLNLLEVKSEISTLQNPIAVLFIDLNKFKQVNDTYGHQYGDFILSKAASRMQKAIRSNDIVGRYGGDEFIILLENVTREIAYTIAKKITNVLSLPYEVDEQIIDFVSASVGISFAPSDGHNAAELIGKADSAMYHAKKSSDIEHIVMADAFNETAKKNKTLRSELTNASENNELFIRVQPIISLHNSNIVGGEVLARWLNLYFDEVMPGTFLPLAQSMGIIKKFDLNILAEAMSFFGQKKLPEDFVINVNVSLELFQDTHFLTTLKSLANEQPWIKQHLVLEITESTMIANVEHTTESFAAISQLGIRIAIDNFGTGFSSLMYLKHFSVEFLKIDISFVQHLENSQKDREMIQTIVMLAHTIGARVIVVGIERESQLNILKGYNIDYAQGFLFAKPLLTQSFLQKIS